MVQGGVEDKKSNARLLDATCLGLPNLETDCQVSLSEQIVSGMALPTVMLLSLDHQAQLLPLRSGVSSTYRFLAQSNTRLYGGDLRRRSACRPAGVVGNTVRFFVVGGFAANSLCIPESRLMLPASHPCQQKQERLRPPQARSRRMTVLVALFTSREVSHDGGRRRAWSQPPRRGYIAVG